jgi:predicted membrane-bound mannosyltransferase
MLQKFMDGKKKYSAFIITVLAAVIPLLIQEPEAQQTFMDMVPSVAAAAAGIFYILTQGKIDAEKEKARNAEAQANVVLNNAAAQPVSAAPAQEAQETPATLDVVPFDPKAFHESVMDTVKETYTEVNPCTIFYKARDKGAVTDCQHISQAVDYWNYLVDLAVDAKDWIKEQTEKSKGECGRSPEYYVFNRDFNTTVRAANSLSELAGSKIDWKAKLAPFNRTLYGVGILAGQLLESNLN